MLGMNNHEHSILAKNFHVVTFILNKYTHSLIFIF